ncbi:MAG: NAD(P)-dependent alcohol dehydrogenase [Polyangiaceae bacterium]
MKAAVYEHYGPPSVVALREVADPVPRDDELLVEVRATTVSSGDARLRALRTPPGFALLTRLVMGVFAPRRRTLGVELAGVVAAVGSRVSRFAVGDEIVAMTGARMGAHAELCVISEREPIVHKPRGLTFEQAAALSFGGHSALDFLRRGALARGERLLIIGATGAVGSAAVQLAKHTGARVTAVCSAANAELARSLGADEVIDYAKKDCLAGSELYDVIMDTVGDVSFGRARRSLAPRGRLLFVAAGLPTILAGVARAPFYGQRVVAGPALGRVEDLATLADLAEQGVYTPVIDRVVPFADITEAHARVDSGHKRGSVVITMSRDGSRA